MILHGLRLQAIFECRVFFEEVMCVCKIPFGFIELGKCQKTLFQRFCIFYLLSKFNRLLCICDANIVSFSS
ncbi:MAG: hypothetical protein CMR00_08565 [[Chlorobium] sp. 445]|nr:MAG: hypothetical protein CMR00_08565 [[Chlorobium] sp. 445]